MMKEFNKASSPLTLYRGMHETNRPGHFIISLLAVALLISSGCSGIRVCKNERWTGIDKPAHFLGTAAMAAGATYLAAEKNDTEEAFIIGWSFSMAIGTGKELVDAGIRDTCFSWKDIFWDFLGATAGATVGAMAAD